MSNLPPGVSESMIPGNRPEDIAYEKLWDEIADKAEELQYPIMSAAGDLDDRLVQLVDWTYQKGFDTGYSRASDDAKMNLLYDQMEHEDMEGGDVDDDS